MMGGTNDLLTALGEGETPSAPAFTPTPEVPPTPSGGAVPLDHDNIERARTAGKTGARRGRPPKDPNAPPRDKKAATAAKLDPGQEAAVVLDPAVLKALKGQLRESYAIALSLLAFAPVVFTPEESPAIEEGLFYCIETYLPAGMGKHLPAFLLVAVSLSAINRARQEKATKAKAKDK